MKLYIFIIMGLFNLLFGTGAIEQEKLIDITSKSEEGFQDLIFNIIDKKLDSNNNWFLTVKGQYKSTVIGFKVVIKNSIQPGIVDGKPAQTGMIFDAGYFYSSGDECDKFIKTVSSLYGVNTNKNFSINRIPFNCFSLNSVVADLNNGNYKFKIFLDSHIENGCYCELYLNIDLQAGFLEFNEKDPCYRENIIKVFTR